MTDYCTTQATEQMN